MTRYELLKANEDLVFQFVKKGILSYQIIRDIAIYEAYVSSEIEYREARLLVIADQYELGRRRVEQIIYTMSQ